MGTWYDIRSWLEPWLLHSVGPSSWVCLGCVRIWSLYVTVMIASKISQDILGTLTATCPWDHMPKGGLCLASNPARSESSAAKLTKRAKDFSSSALSLSCVSPPANESQNPGRVRLKFTCERALLDASCFQCNHDQSCGDSICMVPLVSLYWHMKKEQIFKTEELICNLSKLISFDFRLTCRSLSCFSLI